jgi:hypothetical protein
LREAAAGPVDQNNYRLNRACPSGDKKAFVLSQEGTAYQDGWLAMT